VEQIRGSEGAGMIIDELKPFTHSYIYLSSPYSLWPRGQDDAAETVARLAARLIAPELPIFSPIAHGHAIARAGAIDLHSPVWLQMDQFFCRWASVFLVADLEGWQSSKGCKQEFEWCSGQPRFLLDPVSLALSPLDVWPCQNETGPQ
jgi:hypothetical protein